MPSLTPPPPRPEVRWELYYAPQVSIESEQAGRHEPAKLVFFSIVQPVFLPIGLCDVRTTYGRGRNTGRII